MIGFEDNSIHLNKAGYEFAIATLDDGAIDGYPSCLMPIWINDDKWKQVVDEIINNKSTKEKHLKSISNVLLKNSKNNELKKYIDIIRKKRNEDFFSYEL